MREERIMMYKKLQKVLAVALMTSFLSTSFLVGVSEAAAASHNGGRGPAQHQQIRPQKRSAPQHKAQPMAHKSAPQHKAQPMMHKGGSSHHGKAVHKSASHHKAQPMMHKSGPSHHGPAVNKNGSHHKAQPMAHKNGSIHRGPAVHKNGAHHKAHPMMHKGDTIHRGPVMHKSDHRHGGPVVVHRSEPQHHQPTVIHHYPVHSHHHESYRKDDTGKVIGALLIGGIIGAIIANNNHHHNNVETVEYAGTEEQWDAIVIGTNNEALINAKKKTDGTYVSATGIGLDRTEVTLSMFHTDRITATVEPENATNTKLVWTSSDTDIVKVSEDGSIEAGKKAGTATITVAIEGEAVATCTVTVPVNANIPETAVDYGKAGDEGDGKLVIWYLTNEGELCIYSEGGTTLPALSSAGKAPWYAQRDSIKSLTVGEGRSSLGRYSFMNYTNLATANLPVSLTNIDRQVFGSSGNTLTTVNYAGTEEQWSKITIGATNNRLINSTGFVFRDPEAEVTTVGIEITTPPTKVEYELGEELDLTGLAVTATMSDDSTKDVTADVEVSGFDSEEAGEKTLTVTYQEGETVVTAAFSVTVNAPASTEVISGTCGAAGNEENVTWVLTEDGVLTIEDAAARAGMTEDAFRKKMNDKT